MNLEKEGFRVTKEKRTMNTPKETNGAFNKLMTGNRGINGIESSGNLSKTK
jgi:hypothetical protein